jgi:hypothetical protein
MLFTNLITGYGFELQETTHEEDHILEPVFDLGSETEVGLNTGCTNRTNQWTNNRCIRI